MNQKKTKGPMLFEVGKDKTKMTTAPLSKKAAPPLSPSKARLGPGEFGIGDAVKIKLQGRKKFENVYVEVQHIAPQRVIGIVRDVVWHDKDHGFQAGSIVRFKPQQVLKVEHNPRYLSGLVYPRHAEV